MARLVTKFKYLKPSARKGAGGYAKYIATREGVEKIDDTQKLAPATAKQKELIGKILQDFPQSKDMIEYDDYLQKPNMSNASEFIHRAVEDNTDEMMSSKTYADYIATRPRAERFGSHGLFTDEGVQVQLGKVSEELNLHEGNVWTAIVSLRREDAERLGFNTGARWRDMLRAQTQEFSDQFHIPMNDLKWFAAFHNEGHHPHVHLMVYSENPKQGYLSQKGVEQLRSSLAKEIFAQDLLSVYEKQTAHRDTLRQHSRELIAEIVSKINAGAYDNPVLEDKLSTLADALSKTSGKKVYGYLKADVKDMVDSIVDELAADSRIAELYDLWYRQREEVIRTYTDELPQRVPLSQNKEFKSIRNAVIQEALNISLRTDIAEDIDDSVMIDIEPPTDEADQEYVPSKEKNPPKMWGKYHLAKELLDRERETYDPDKAVELLIDCANMGCGVAKYRLGKMFLRGEDVPKNIDYALRWLEESAVERNPFAAYLAGKIRLTEDAVKDILKAIRNFEIAAESGNDYAEYMLGKIYLYGREVERDYDKAIAYLTPASEHGNVYAAQILHSIHANRNWSAAMGTIRLLHHISRIIQNRLEDERRGKGATIDRKLRRKIDEKKQAHGLKQG